MCCTDTYTTDKNWYALLLAIFKRYSIRKSISIAKKHPYIVARNAKKKKYKEIGEACTILKYVGGSSYRTIGKVLHVNFKTVQHAIKVYEKEHRNETLHKTFDN